MITRAMKIAYDMSYQYWVPDESLAYTPNEKDKLSSRLYGVIGADTSGLSYVHFRGFGPEYDKLIKKISKGKEVEFIGNDVIVYPSDGYALGLLKETAIEGRKLGFQYGAAVNLGSISRAIDPFVDGTLLGRVEKKMVKAAKIIWKKPNLKNELGEYFENNYTKRFFDKMGLRFEKGNDLYSFLSNGKMTKLSKKDLVGSENITIESKDFSNEIKDEQYAKNYNKMKEDLQSGKLKLEAPILIKFQDFYYGFSGNRRMNLAWNNNIPVEFWVVELKMTKKEKVASKLETHIRIAQKLLLATNAEKEAEKALKVILPGTEFANKAHAVGGYVRDEILADLKPESGIEAKDLDIVVEMKGGAKKITQFLHNTLKNSKGEAATHRPHQIGAGYPIWSLQFFPDENGDVEVEGKIYKTSGGEIEFADTQKEAFPDPESRQRVTQYGTLDEDIKRRDFTTNMLLKDMTSGEIKDLTGVSKSDIEKGVLRGHPEVDLNTIFEDDPLRMVRLIRFKVKYDWDIPADVKAIAKKNAHRLNILSAERLRDELTKVMKYGKLPEAISLMKELGFDKVEAGKDEELNPVSFLMKEMGKLDISHESPYHIDTDDVKDDKVIDHTINVIKKAKNSVHAQLAALLHDIGKAKTKTKDEVTGKTNFLKHEEAGLDIAEDILRKLKFDKKTIDKVLRLIGNHMRPHNLEKASDKALRKFIREIGDDLDDVLDLAKADSEGKNPPSPYIDELRKRIDVLQNAVITPKVKPVLNGKEVMDILSIKTGPKVGEVNEYLMDLQDENPELTKEDAKSAILKKFK